MMREIAITLLLLHGADGGVVTINADQITSMREARDDASGKHFAANARCMISFTDGKFVAVIEPCKDVREMIK